MKDAHITAVVPPEYKEWLLKKVEAHDYGSISHGITQLIRDEIRREKGKKNE